MHSIKGFIYSILKFLEQFILSDSDIRLYSCKLSIESKRLIQEKKGWDGNFPISRSQEDHCLVEQSESHTNFLLNQKTNLAMTNPPQTSWLVNSQSIKPLIMIKQLETPTIFLLHGWFELCIRKLEQQLRIVMGSFGMGSHNHRTDRGCWPKV